MIFILPWTAPEGSRNSKRQLLSTASKLFDPLAVWLRSTQPSEARAAQMPGLPPCKDQACPNEDVHTPKRPSGLGAFILAHWHGLHKSLVRPCRKRDPSPKYACVFASIVTKAVHLEFVPEMTTVQMLQALP
ncbi:hypothetical protein T08_1903 [Trichinella sp. T8]|nr:hypothetical protein T08_1903 [Trichinella sp. T8]